MSLYALVYISKSLRTISEEDIRQILKSSQRNNRQCGISGYLYFNGTYFIQYLEGTREEVRSCFTHITRDERHDVLLYTDTTIEQKKFANWSMRVLVDSPEGEVSLEDLMIIILRQLPERSEQDQKLAQVKNVRIWQMIDRIAEQQNLYLPDEEGD